MPIVDNNPERRNLMITSLAFVVYFLGGGRIESGSLRIQAVNITFDNLMVLTVTAWALLIWFFWRYQQKHKGAFFQALASEAKGEHDNPVLISYLKRKLEKPHRAENGFVVNDIDALNGSWTVQFANIDGGRKGDDGQWIEYRTVGGSRFSIRWAWFGFVRLAIIIFTSYKKPGFGSWIVPPMLFYAACVLGAIEALKC